MPKKGTNKITTSEIQTYIREYLETGSYSEVAERHGKIATTIRQAIERYRMNNLEEYTKMYNYYLQKKEEEFIEKTTRVIDKITDRISERVEDDDTTLSQMSTTLGILYDKRQLSQGKSTQNNAIVIQLKGDIQDLAQ